MSYQPVVPLGGVGGWAFLSRTREAQEAAFQSGAALTRDTDYFEARIGEIASAEDLVGDRRLLRVALGAFGLDADIDARAFVRKVLEEGTLSGEGLANRLSDKRYFGMAEAFGFDLDPPNTALSTFGAEIVAQYRERQFEAAVGEASPDMLLALSLERELSTVTDRNLSDSAAWFTVMATPPLRAVFERALSIPPTAAVLDIDRQLDLFREKAEAVFGSSDFARFGTPGGADALRQTFLARSELSAAPVATGRGSAALALLQASQGPGLGPLLS